LGKIVAPEPIDAPLRMIVGSTFQSASVCGPRIRVVCKGHAVSDKDVIFDSDAFANESVAGNLASAPDPGVLLDFDKGTYLCLVPDLAPVQIYELGKADIHTQFHIIGNAIEIVHR
jgi:hypothetical protein